MPRTYKFDFLIDEHINVDGYGIYTQVIKSPHAGVRNDVLMLVAGGPGFPGTRVMRSEAVALHKLATEKKSRLPHIILFDPLGCGESECANSMDEYNVSNYARLNVRLLEEIQKKLQLTHMNVHLDGRSFGGIMVMKMADFFQSPYLRLRQIISVAGADGAGLREYGMKFLDTHFSDHPQLVQMKAAQTKLYNGDFQDQADYINNFVLVMAQLYSKKAAEVLNSRRGTIIKKFPVAMASAMNFANNAANFFGFEYEEFAKEADVLNHCSLPVINHFFKNDFNGYKVSENLGAGHKDKPVTFIVSEQDHVIDPQIAIENQKKLSNSAVFVIKGTHINDGEGKKVTLDLVLDLVADGNFNEKLIQQSNVVKEFHYTDDYFSFLTTVYPHRKNQYRVGSTGTISSAPGFNLEKVETTSIDIALATTTSSSEYPPIAPAMNVVNEERRLKM